MVICVEMVNGDIITEETKKNSETKISTASRMSEPGEEKPESVTVLAFCRDL